MQGFGDSVKQKLLLEDDELDALRVTVGVEATLSEAAIVYEPETKLTPDFNKNWDSMNVYIGKVEKIMDMLSKNAGDINLVLLNAYIRKTNEDNNGSEHVLRADQAIEIGTFFNRFRGLVNDVRRNMNERQLLVEHTEMYSKKLEQFNNAEKTGLLFLAHHTNKKDHEALRHAFAQDRKLSNVSFLGVQSFVDEPRHGLGPKGGGEGGSPVVTLH